MSLILALDPATMLGWATYDGAHYLSGVVNLGRAAEKGIVRDIGRVKRFQEFLSDFARAPYTRHAVTLLAIEGSAGHQFRQAAKVASQLEGVAFAWAGRWDIPVVRVAPAELKKWATGDGRASKAEMTEAAAQMTGAVVYDDNEADALCVCAWSLEHMPK